MTVSRPAVGADHGAPAQQDPADPAARVSGDPAGHAPDVPGDGRRDLLRRIAIYAPGTILPGVLSVVTTMVFTRLFSATDYGAYSLVLIYAILVKLVMSQWVLNSIGRFVPEDLSAEGQRRVSQVVARSALLVVLAELVLGIVALAAASALIPEQQSLVLPAVAFVVVTTLFEVAAAQFPAKHLARESVTYRLTDAALTFGLRLVLVLPVVGMGISLMLWSVVLSNAVLLPIMWRRAGLPTRVRVRAPSADQAVLFRSFLSYGIPMSLWTVATLVLDVQDRYLIRHFIDLEAVGVYEASYRLVAGSVALVLAPITMTLAPQLFTLSGSGDAGRIGRALGAIVENLLSLGALAVALAAIFYTDLAGFILGPEFREGAVIIPIVMAGFVVFNVGIFTHKPFEIANRTVPMVLLAVMAVVLNLGLNLALIPLLGYMGAAWATLLASTAYALGAAVTGRRLLPWRLPNPRRMLLTMAVIGAGGSLIVAARSLLPPVPYPVELAFVAILGAAFGAAVLRVLLRRVMAAPAL